MNNRIKISICGEEYTLLADEAPSYMQKVAGYVSDRMQETLDSAHVGRTDAAVLTALNIADELMKSQEAAENLRSQLKGYLDENARKEKEISELKRELFKLQNRSGSAGGKH